MADKKQLKLGVNKRDLSITEQLLCVSSMPKSSLQIFQSIREEFSNKKYKIKWRS